MKNLIRRISEIITLSTEEMNAIEKAFEPISVSAGNVIIEASKKAEYLYFIDNGIVKGYENIDGEIVVQHLVETNDFFTALESFWSNTHSKETYESLTDCVLYKISKSNFDLLATKIKGWQTLVNTITNAHLQCKMERTKDFQTLNATQRYEKFVRRNPNLALKISVENIASYLGMKPQSLSRIRKQVTF